MAETPEIAFRAAEFDTGPGAALLQAMRDEMHELYEGLDMDSDAMPRAGAAELGPPGGALIAGWVGDDAVCVGAVKRLDDATCEIKRMYVAPPWRGRGIARRLLQELEAISRRLGYAVARLDTGPKQDGARRLYESAGYAPIGNFNANPIASFWARSRSRHLRERAAATVTQRLTGRLRERADVLLAFDPGLNQLLMATGVMAGIAACLGAIYLFSQVTHAMWIEAPAGVHLSPAMVAQLDAQHHGVTLLAMLLGGLIGMLSAFAVVDTDPRELAVTMALMPLPMLATMALSVQFLHERTLGILAMAVVMGVGTYIPKFGSKIGPRAFVFGQMLFVGYLVGFLSRGAVADKDLGWIAAILWVAAAVCFVLKLAVFVPLRRGALRRTIQAFFARSRGVIASSADVFTAAAGRERQRTRRRLQRRLARLNEAALIADALLIERQAIAHETHARLFETELTVQNIGRLSDALCEARLPADIRLAVTNALAQARDGAGVLDDRSLVPLQRFAGDEAALRDHPLEAGRVLRLADALVGWRLALGRWSAVKRPVTEAAEAEFQSPVTLMFGNLPGSALVSLSAASPPGTRRARYRLDLPAQSAIRLTVAVAAAAALGSILSERRFYWAVIAVFIAFIGANTTGEQLTKAANRVAGTVVGILLGSLLAHAIGDSTWSVLVIVLSLGFGVYFLRASYALMVIGVTITVSQLYVQLGEYSNHLLVLRLEETAIGAAVAGVAALLVFPLAARKASRVATREYYAELGELLARLADRLDGRPDGEDGMTSAVSLTAASRSLDNASHQLRSAALPLSRTPFRRDEVEHNLLLFAQASHHARNVAADVQDDLQLRPRIRSAATVSLRTQRRLVGCLQRRVDNLATGDGNGNGHADDSGALTEALRLEGDLLGVALDDGSSRDERRFLRHIARLDETLAELGDNLARREG